MQKKRKEMKGCEKERGNSQRFCEEWQGKRRTWDVCETLLKRKKKGAAAKWERSNFHVRIASLRMDYYNKQSWEKKKQYLDFYYTHGGNSAEQTTITLTQESHCTLSTFLLTPQSQSQSQLFRAKRSHDSVAKNVALQSTFTHAVSFLDLCHFTVCVTHSHTVTYVRSAPNDCVECHYKY